MGVLKKLGLDVLISVVLFVVAVFIAGAVSIENRSCVTCGANIATTFWFAAVLSLQPPLWASQVPFKNRALIWGSSLVVGVVVYVVLELLAAQLLSGGAVSWALRLGSLANVVGVLGALLTSVMLVRVQRRGMKPNPAVRATIEP